MLFLMILQVLGSNDNSSNAATLTITFKKNKFVYTLNNDLKNTSERSKEFPEKFSTVTIELPHSLIITDHEHRFIVKKEFNQLFDMLTKHKISNLYITTQPTSRVLKEDNGTTYYDIIIYYYLLILTRFLFCEGSVDYIFIDNIIPDSMTCYRTEIIRKNSSDHLMKFACFYYLWKKHNPDQDILLFFNNISNRIQTYLENDLHRYSNDIMYRLKILLKYERNNTPVDGENFDFGKDLLKILDGRIEQINQDKKKTFEKRVKSFFKTPQEEKDCVSKYLHGDDFILWIFNMLDIKEYMKSIYYSML